MNDANYFDDILANIRREVAEHGDLTTALDSNLPDLLAGITDHPLDHGSRRFRSLTLSGPTGGQGSSERSRNDWMLIVRAISEGGDDVVSFTNADDWTSTIVGFCFKAATDAVEWKEDHGGQKRASAVNFFDTLTARSGNGSTKDRNVGTKRPIVVGNRDSKLDA